MVTKLIIFKKEGEYYCRIVFEKIPEFISEDDLVYQDEEEEKKPAEKRAVIQEMKNKAKEYAREQGIDFVHDLDF